MSGQWNFQRKGREPAFNIPAVIVILVLICVGVYFLPPYVLSRAQYYDFMRLVVFVPQVSFSQDDPLAWFSVIGYSFMHGSISHLVVNMCWLVVFGSPLANRLGVIGFILFWVVSAVVSVVPYCFLPSSTVFSVVGASGAISAMMGAAARYGFVRVSGRRNGGRPEFAGPIWSMRAALSNPMVLWLIGGWVLSSLVIGVYGQSNVAWEAHLVGVVFGFLGIGLFDSRRHSVF